MRFIDAATIRRTLTFPILIDAIEAAHRRPPMEMQDAFLGTEGAQYFVRHAVDPGRHMASKLITSFPGNIGGPLPAVQAICVLFDGANGQPLAVMDGTEITYWRTAADSALGARLLAPAAPHTLLVVGAGEMSRWLIRAHRTVRPSIGEILIWNRTADRAQAVADHLAAEGIAATPVTDLATATARADIITCCTRSHAPLIQGRNLKPGTHLDLVGGYTEHTREADDTAAQRARIFVDTRYSAFAGVGDILGPIASGAITEASVLSDLHGLVAGFPGRTDPADITLYKNAGGGHLDLIAAETVFSHLEPSP